jgi:hypothetical protein
VTSSVTSAATSSLHKSFSPTTFYPAKLPGAPPPTKSSPVSSPRQGSSPATDVLSEDILFYELLSGYF